MDKRRIYFCCCFALIGLLVSGCASTKILTLNEINDNIGGLPNLQLCQFFISKDVTLNFQSDSRITDIQESGTVVAERRIERRNIRIASSTPGILQTRNNSGDNLAGYDRWENSQGRPLLTLYILFEEDDDNAIAFTAWYDNVNDRFELADSTVNFDGIIYQINYSGEEMPYLKYKLLERVSVDETTRRAAGRRVGN